MASSKVTSSIEYPLRDTFFLPSVTYGPNLPLLIETSFFVFGSVPKIVGSNFNFLSLMSLIAVSYTHLRAHET